jgi:small subunit ribosomal protein S17
MSTSSRKAAMAKKDSATARPPRMKIKKGDHVVIVAGRDRGREGTVIVEDRVKHPKYGKVIRRTKKYTAHDGENACGVGDRVRLMETRPLSATKRWRVSEILEKAK